MMNDELLIVGKDINNIKTRLKEELKKIKQTPETNNSNVKIISKDIYEPNDKLQYYRKNSDKKNIAVFINYDQKNKNILHMKPTDDTKKNGGPFKITKDRVIGVVTEKSS